MHALFEPLVFRLFFLSLLSIPALFFCLTTNRSTCSVSNSSTEALNGVYLATNGIYVKQGSVSDTVSESDSSSSSSRRFLPSAFEGITAASRSSGTKAAEASPRATIELDKRGFWTIGVENGDSYRKAGVEVRREESEEEK